MLKIEHRIHQKLLPLWLHTCRRKTQNLPQMALRRGSLLKSTTAKNFRLNHETLVTFWTIPALLTTNFTKPVAINLCHTAALPPPPFRNEDGTHCAPPCGNLEHLACLNRRNRSSPTKPPILGRNRDFEGFESWVASTRAPPPAWKSLFITFSGQFLWPHTRVEVECDFGWPEAGLDVAVGVDFGGGRSINYLLHTKSCLGNSSPTGTWTLAFVTARGVGGGCGRQIDL